MNRRAEVSGGCGDRAVRLVLSHEGGYDSQWAAVLLSEKSSRSRETLGPWMRQAERDLRRREHVITEERERIKDLERENRELRGEGDPPEGSGVCFPGRSSIAERGDGAPHPDGCFDLLRPQGSPSLTRLAVGPSEARRVPPG